MMINIIYRTKLQFLTKLFQILKDFLASLKYFHFLHNP